jgi:hypothetical protein
MRRQQPNLLNRYAAACKIQTIVRRSLAKKQYQALLMDYEIQRRVTAAMILVRFRKKMLHKRQLITHCVTLQRWWRGAVLRFKVYLEVLAGYKIRNAWKRHLQYWKLKRRLRRNDYPISLTLHEIVNLPPSVIETGQVKVIVSIWWSKLLHLVEQDDYTTIMHTKPPNIIRTSSYFSCTETKIEQSATGPAPAAGAATVGGLSHDGLRVGGGGGRGRAGSPSSTPLHHRLKDSPALQAQILQEFSRRNLTAQHQKKYEDRKMSLVQKAQVLGATNHHRGSSLASPKKVLSAAEALAQFAKVHGVQGANLKTGSSLQRAGGGAGGRGGGGGRGGLTTMKENEEKKNNKKKKSSSDSESEEESEEEESTVSATPAPAAPIRLKTIAKKVSLQRSSLIQFSQGTKEAAKLAHLASPSSSSSSSSSEDDDSDGEDVFEQNQSTALLPHTNTHSSVPPITGISKRSSLAYDTIGRQSVNTIGMNLLTHSEMPHNSHGDTDTSLTAGGLKFVDALQALHSTVSFAADLTSGGGGGGKKVSLKPLPKKSTVKIGRPGALEHQLFSMGLASLVGKNSPKTPVGDGVLYQVDLQEETLYIPGCHGNSVIKFDIYDDM